MSESKGIGKAKILILLIALVIIATGIFLVINNIYTVPNSSITEAANDLKVDVDQTNQSPPSYDQQNPSNNSGSSSGEVPKSSPTPTTITHTSYNTDNKGIIDIVSASIEKDQTTFNLNIQVKDPIIPLGTQESAQFDILTILEDDEEVLNTYEFIININSTGIFCTVQNIQTNILNQTQLVVDGSILSVTSTISELRDAVQAEWNILSTYEVMADNQIIFSAYDFAPDEGIKTTLFSIGE